MAAIFPIRTDEPWTFNGVTYEYDASEDRWFVISTNKTDSVDRSLETLDRSVDVINTVIDAEIENRTNLLNAAAGKNNEQDSRIEELEDRIELIASNIGVLEFAGLFEYMPIVTQADCDAAFSQCVLDANGDFEAIGACTAEQARCEANITTELPNGKFTSDSHVYANVEFLRVSNQGLNGVDYAWSDLIEPGDYIELVEQNLRDTVLYQVLTDIRADSENIRVQYVRQTNLGDSEFNNDEQYAIRVFKEEIGLDLNAGDARYVKRPYTVLFSDVAPDQGEDFTGVLQNGELWYDTENLELFVWNNNAWVTTSKPPAQDVVLTQALADIDALQDRPQIISSNSAPANPKQGDLWFNPTTLKFAFYTAGAWINPDQS